MLNEYDKIDDYKYCISESGNILSDTNMTILDINFLYENVDNPTNIYKFRIENKLIKQYFENEIFVDETGKLKHCLSHVEFSNDNLLQGEIYFITPTMKTIDIKDLKIIDTTPVDEFGNLFIEPKIKLDIDLHIRDKLYIDDEWENNV
tara:strand:+ start:769 stop:1212 length:444 start_codon:yes stop_codon:yes gene_type:complete